MKNGFVWHLMKTLALCLFIVFYSIFALAEEKRSPDDGTSDAEAFLKKALDLWHIEQDYNGALEAFSEAVEADSKNLKIRHQRALFFLTVAEIVIDEDKEKFQSLARDDYNFINQSDPNSISAGIARDTLALLDNRMLFKDKTISCPEEADQAYEQAENLFFTRQYKESLKFFEKASSLCPSNANIWVSYADSYFMLEEYLHAKKLFLKAIEADRWNRKARRFLTDTENRMGNNKAALKQAAFAVISDPTYEAAWASLRSLSKILDRQWQRVYGDKTIVTKNSKNNGGIKVTVSVSKDTKEDEKQQAPKEKVKDKEIIETDIAIWTTYGISKAAVYAGIVMGMDENGNWTERKIDLDKLTPFKVEKLAVESTLQIWLESNDEPQENASPFWSMMARAEQAGFLDEAIFLHMIDEELVPEYLKFRGKNENRLVEYIEKNIVPKRKNPESNE